MNKNTRAKAAKTMLAIIAVLTYLTVMATVSKNDECYDKLIKQTEGGLYE